ncbi:hypothetical protein C8A03DRAFT_37863 [Achaetomium macrosporum]|uniref:Extracellular membrane protein CFEM domain-containing protein n=1 Tax=Achaetomium macrosporum TaxID=79813 RepID=A0AAN7HAZ6_9PEZI|nr:hypothetical protein C8A03DRAFT_37863 [Achaetomium macrosporum]
MGFNTGLLRRLLCLLLHFQALLAVETVSEFGEDWPHSCVPHCLGRWPVLYDNIGAALRCGDPFYNDCYCATAAASASRATSFLESCASASCNGGDLTVDLSAMQSKYASYCMVNGFTQPGATNWYNPAATTTRASPAPGSTGAAGPASTTTQVTVVTQTTTPGSSGGSSSQPRVTTVDATSTVWVNPAGSVVSAPSSDRNNNALALGLGVGLGVALALAVAGFGTWMCIRRKRRRQPLASPNDAALPPMGDGPAASPSPIPRKSVAAAAATPSPLSDAPGTSELGGQGIRPELGGTGLHPFPDVAPSPPVAVPGQHELHGLGRQPELPGQPRSPPPQYSQVVAASGTPAGRDRWELP